MTRTFDIARGPRSEHGFTMIVAIGVMFVTSMLLVAAFTIANGNIQLSRDNTTQKQAYYAALAGLQEYEYQLQSDPDFWQTCKKLESTVAEESSEKYTVTPIVAESAPSKYTSCSTESPFSSMIQSSGRFTNTFRVESVGEVQVNHEHKSTRKIVATFGVTGFLDYLWYTDYETEDPGLYVNQNKTLATECAGKHYEEWKGKYKCPPIEWNGDTIAGPFHTEDTAYVTGSATFGRSGHEPKDVVEMKGGTYGASSGCKGAVYNTASGCYEKGYSLPMPAEDTSLSAYVESTGHYYGETWMELEGDKMTIKYYNSGGTLVTEHNVSLPKNGLIYVQDSTAGCAVTEFEAEGSDTSAEITEAKGCGTVFVSGYYKESLTIAGEADVIVDGNIYPEGTTVGNEPSGTAVLGLIANEYVRVYHPCTGNSNTVKWENPWIYAAILATQHSWIVDNADCGSLQGKLNIYGALAQNYRGVVYRNGHGYEKHYVYDERLATDEPPYFLAPLKAGWKIEREASPSFG